MGNVIQIKRGASVPTASILTSGELGYCTSDGKLYIGTSSSPVAINSGSATSDKNGLQIDTSYLKLSGGTMTGQISAEGKQASWYNGRDFALIRTTTSGTQKYCPILSNKTADGSWEIGTYTDNNLHFSYIRDDHYSSGTNARTAAIVFGPSGVVIADKFDGLASKATADRNGSQIDTTYLKLSGGTMTGTITSSYSTGTHLNGNKGGAIINSTAEGKGYNMLAKMNSTNGYFCIGSYGTRFKLYYTAKSTVDAGTNTITKDATLLDESGNTVLPGALTAASLSINGTAGITGNVSIGGILNLTRTTDASGTADNGPALIIGPRTGAHLELDGNELMAKSSGTAVARLYINTDGGIVSVGSGGLTVNGKWVYPAQVLYSNASGNSGTITLSSSAANFTMLEIYYGKNDGAKIQHSTRVYSPNGAKAVLSQSFYINSASCMQTVAKVMSISGTTMSIVSGYNAYANIYSSSAGSSPSTTEIAVFYVIGYSTK